MEFSILLNLFNQTKFAAVGDSKAFITDEDDKKNEGISCSFKCISFLLKICWGFHSFLLYFIVIQVFSPTILLNTLSFQ